MIIIYVLIAVVILAWVGLSAWAFFRDKMLALTLFFTIPVVAVFIALFALIILVASGKMPG